MGLPETIGRYRVLGPLASGGMGEILLAKLEGPGGFERPVVIKRVLPHLAREPELRAMFLDEARLMARIRHPSVVRITELGEDGESLFMVMDYLEGETLGSLRKRLSSAGRTLCPALALLVIEALLEGLHAAHEALDEDGKPLGVVHRDVSPQNVFVGYDATVRVLDFGIARFADRSARTETGHIKGKFSYMSPEQCRGGELDRRSDLFSTGILLWELLTGRRLFARASDMLTWKAIVEEAIPRVSDAHAALASAAPGIDALVAKALARAPSARYQDAESMRVALAALRRRLDPEDGARAELALLMRRLFEARIEEKRELVRRVQSGSAVVAIPSAEAERSSSSGAPAAPDELELDVAVDSEVETASSERSLEAPRARPRRSLGVAAAVAAVLVVVGSLGITILHEEEPAPPIAVASPPVAAEPPVTLPAAAPARVRVELTSAPPGARVEDEIGTVLGVTPCVVELERGDAARALRMVLEGHEPHVATLVPDVQRGIAVALRPLPPPEAVHISTAPPASPRRRRAPSEPGTRPESPFYRFR